MKQTRTKQKFIRLSGFTRQAAMLCLLFISLITSFSTYSIPRQLDALNTDIDFGEATKEDSSDRGVTTYTRDDAGNVKTMTDARGITAYKEKGRIK